MKPEKMSRKEQRKMNPKKVFLCWFEGYSRPLWEYFPSPNSIHKFVRDREEKIGEKEEYDVVPATIDYRIKYQKKV